MKQDLVAIIAELTQVEATITLQALPVKFVKRRVTDADCQSLVRVIS